MKDDTLTNAITYIFLLRVKSFPKMYVTLCPSKWYHSPPLAHALGGGRFFGGGRLLERGRLFEEIRYVDIRKRGNGGTNECDDPSPPAVNKTDSEVAANRFKKRNEKCLVAFMSRRSTTRRLCDPYLQRKYYGHSQASRK